MEFSWKGLKHVGSDPSIFSRVPQRPVVWKLLKQLVRKVISRVTKTK
jgi:hypothetical protein